MSVCLLCFLIFHVVFVCTYISTNSSLSFDNDHLFKVDIPSIKAVVEDGSQSATVVAPAGTFIGTKQTYEGVNYLSFLGIKYARPVRFKTAVKVSRRGEVVSATNYGPECLQVNQSGIHIGSSDCLYINIFTPNVTGSLPVIFYIHGGRYEAGSPKFKLPDYFLITKRVVYVNVQFRIGPLGFLDFNTRGYPSNLGARDLIMALEWVQENIKAFGGDPKNIVLKGQSSGAVLINILTGSPKAKGLFSGGVLMSGTGCGAWSTVPRETARYALIMFARAASCPLPHPDPNRSALATALCLEKLTDQEIVDTFVRAKRENIFLLRPYSPVMEGPGMDSVIPEYIWKLPTNIPHFYLVNTNEGRELFKSFWLTPSILKTSLVEGKFKPLMPLMFLYRDTSLRPDDTTNQLISYYLGGQNLTQDNLISFWEKVAGDIMYYIPRDKCLRLQSSGSAWSMYFGYMGSQDTNLSSRLFNVAENLIDSSPKDQYSELQSSDEARSINLNNKRKTDQQGVKHGGEEKYLFRIMSNNVVEDVRLNNHPLDSAISIVLVDLITKFAEKRYPELKFYQSDPSSPRKTVLLTKKGYFTRVYLPPEKDLNFWNSLPYRNKIN